MGKTTDLFTKIRDTKGIFHAKMDLIKNRNSMDPTEAEDIKNRCKNNNRLCSNSVHPKNTKSVNIKRPVILM